MNKKLSKHGNSMALILDKPILELLNITEETVLIIKTDGKSITITPQSIGKKKQKNVQEIADGLMDEYTDVLKKLAK